MEKHPEKLLIENCLKGQQAAFEQLYNKFSGKMMSVCLRYLKDEDQAKDAMQDSFIKVFKNLKFYQFEGSFEGWVRKTVVNTCLDAIRKNKQMQDSTSVDEAFDLSIDQASIISKMTADELMQIIANIPSGYRTVFNLFAIEGYSHKEIADMLGVTENTSKTQYRKARFYIQKCIEELNAITK